MTETSNEPLPSRSRSYEPSGLVAAHLAPPVIVQVTVPSGAVVMVQGPSVPVDPVGRATTQVPAGTAPTRVRMVPTTDGDGYRATWAASTVWPIGTLTWTVPGS
ncbi:hypothetical protein GALL_444640 [mine drainage metagenome]|uniref:Uncharacterized protein n=1 Tax=mine drainage metagenome TaxID=410659 RepID=A0A1J5PSV5_9ZZZZ